MKKIIRLSESDLIRIVKRVISEETNQTLGECITNYKTANENWDKFEYVDDDDDKLFLRRAYKKGSNRGEEDRIAIQRIQFIVSNGKKSILSSYSLPDQQGLNTTASFQDIIPYDDDVKDNCPMIKQKLDYGFRNFIKNV
jgi:hypothetical protein